MRNALELVEVDSERLEEVLRRAERSLDEKDAELVRAVFESYAYVTELVEDKNTTIRRPPGRRRRPRGPRAERAPGPPGVPRGRRGSPGRGAGARGAPPAARGPSTRRPPACSCGSSANRRWGRRSTSCRSCAAICAAK